MFRRSLAARAQWGANPADIQFTSWAKRDGNSSTFLASARQTQEYKPVNDQAARMALSVGSPDYFKNVGKDEELLHRNEKTGEIILGSKMSSDNKKMKYAKDLREEHSDQIAMWRQMSERIQEASEDQQHGALEAAHAAIGMHFTSGGARLFNNGEISRIVEQVLEWSTAVHLRSFYFKIAGKLCYLCTQNTASRVVEKLLKQCQQMLKSDKLMKSSDEEDSTGLPTLKALLKGTVDELIEGDEESDIKLIDIILHPGGSYALRVLIYVLAGKVPPEKRHKEAVTVMEPLDSGVPLDKLGKAIVKVLAKDDIFVNRICSTQAAGILDVLASVWEGSELHDQVAANMDDICKSSVSSRVLEACLKSSACHKKLHSHFVKHWEEMMQRGGLYAVQRWVANCPDEESMQEVVEALTKGATAIYNKWALGVLSGVCEGAKRHPSARSSVMSLVKSALQVTGSLFDTLIQLDGHHGVAMLSAMLSYGPSEATAALYKGVAELTVDKISYLLSTVAGSTMIEGFIANAKEKEIKKFSNQLKGSFLQVTTSCGSAAFVVEKLYAVLPLSYRKTVAEELSAGIKQLQSIYSTRMTVKKLRLEQYKHRYEDWEEAEKKEAKKSKMLSSILGSEAKPSAGKKRKRDKNE